MKQKLWNVAALAMAISNVAFASNGGARPARASAQTPDAMAAASVSTAATGEWHGMWTAPGGWLYEADMQISAGLADNITADIHWTLRAAPTAQTAYQGKIGMTGVEHTKGVFLPGDGVVKMEGVSLDDPNSILGMDKYRLIMSDDGSTLGGITWDQGAWDALFMAKRVVK